MSDLAKYVVSNPADATKAMFLPPPGTNPAVQSLYYAQIADITTSAASGLKSVAVKVAPKTAGKASEVISKTMMKRIGTDSLRKFVYSQTRNAVTSIGTEALKSIAGPAAASKFKESREALDKAAKETIESTADDILKLGKGKITQKLAIEAAEAIARDAPIPPSVAKELASSVKTGLTASKQAAEGAKIAKTLYSARVASTAAKFGVKAASLAGRLASNLVFGPVGLALDAIMIGMMAYGLIFDALDKTGIGFVMTPNNIKGYVEEITRTSEKALTDAGIPDYYSGPAEFPVTNLVFQWDEQSNAYVTTPEWGPMYTELVDKYMITQGFDKDWRDKVDAEPMKSPVDGDDEDSSGPSEMTLILLAILAFIFILFCIGGLFFIISI
jgi:hypothetical protein